MSSSRPGASPTNITRAFGLPSANTSWVAVVRNAQPSKRSRIVAQLFEAGGASRRLARRHDRGVGRRRRRCTGSGWRRRSGNAAAMARPIAGSLRGRAASAAAVGMAWAADRRRTGRPASRRPARRRPPPDRRRAARGQPGRGFCSSPGAVRPWGNAGNHACGAAGWKVRRRGRSRRHAGAVRIAVRAIGRRAPAGWRIVCSKWRYLSNWNNTTDRSTCPRGDRPIARSAGIGRPLVSGQYPGPRCDA